MKKIISVLLVLSMLSAFAVGVSGAKLKKVRASNQIAVKTEAEFMAMDPNGHYYLANDITLTGTYSETFCGVFNGYGHTITVSAPIFGNVNGSTISNFRVIGDISIAEASPYLSESGKEDFISAVAVITDGKSVFRDIISDVNITVTSPNTRAASIVATSRAQSEVQIFDCENNGDINVVKYAGGIYGWAEVRVTGLFQGCENNGKISASDGYAGGIVCRGTGLSGNATFYDCVNNAEVVGMTQVAGILAYAAGSSTFYSCVNNGTISVLDGKTGHAGGIIGTTQPMVSDNDGAYTSFHECVNNGNITAGGAKTAGGIAGYVNENVAVFIGCLNTGDILSPAEHAGGICGRAFIRFRNDIARGTQSSFRYCINTGNVTGAQCVGGILGRSGITSGQGDVYFEYCISAGDVTVLYNQNGKPDSTDNGVAGIVGHTRAKASDASEGYRLGGSRVIINNCIVSCDITVGDGLANTRVPAFLIGYSGGGADFTVTNNMVAGKLIDNDSDPMVAGLVYCKSYDLNVGALDSNLIENGYAYTISREKSGVYSDSDLEKKYNLKYFDTEVLTGGEAIYLINQAYRTNHAKNEDIFFMTLDGTFDPTTLSTGENSVLKVDGGYANKLYEPEVTDPAEPAPTGDTAIVFVALAIISVATIAVVSKRREN